LRSVALHGGDDDFVAEGELGEVGFFVCFVGLEALGEEVVEDCFLNGLSVCFFVVGPAGDLLGVFGGVFGEFDDLKGCLSDGFVVSAHFLDDVVIIVDATRNLAVGGNGGGGEEGKGTECEDCFFHVGVNLADEGGGASDEKASVSNEREVFDERNS